MDKPTPRAQLTKAEWEQKIRAIYTEAAEGVIALQNKLGWYERDLQPVYDTKWEEIKTVLKEVPSSEELIGYLKSVGLDIADFEKLYGTEKIKDAIMYAKDLKDRFSVLWVNYFIG